MGKFTSLMCVVFVGCLVACGEELETLEDTSPAETAEAEEPTTNTALPPTSAAKPAVDMPLSPTLNPFEVAMTEHALTKEPSSPWSAVQYLVHGQVQYFLGEYELSMAAFDQAISLDPWMMTDAFFLHQNARLNWDAMQSMVELDAQIAELDRAIDESAEDAEG